MKLGRETGSMTNYMMSGTKGQPSPVVGMGVTLLHWTDRSPGTIIKVSPSGKTITIQEDTAIRTDSNGMSECQAYRYEPNPEGRTFVARAGRKTGAFKCAGGGPQVRLGERDKYHDYSF